MSTPDEPTTHFPAGSPGAFDDSGYSSGYSTTDQNALLDDVEDTRREPDRWHAGLDIGLLVLRLALAMVMGAHGLQKLFGLFDGPGIGGFADALTGMGYTSQTTLLAWITAVSETGGALLLALGLFTPLGAAAILGVTANIVFTKFQLGSGYFDAELDIVLALMALTLLFTGAGRVSIDKNTPWRRKPGAFGAVGLLLAAAASTVVIVLFR
ncbi:DoxX family protein [Prauserella rugosa]|uniref:Putative oxidoreductase n=1 Tax=Prauserella rugosa TaxID=43354 RepID=A0A660CNT8_9PSEU|nr:DoxX family protein [Prauserella rugosa]KMS89853.1 membrane protein [Streptomyces regensis]TWH22805.1 putative oxidoreductase [Prauserella rugosa]